MDIISTEYFVGDIRKKVVIDVGEDISGEGVTAQIKYRKPNNAVGSWDAVVDSNGQSISHSLDSTDLDIPGLWRIQPYVNIGTGADDFIGYGPAELFLVYPNLTEVYTPPTSTSIYQNLNLVYAKKIFSCDGIRTTFTLDAPARENSIFVFLNGVLQQEDVDYTIDSSNQVITSINTYENGDLLEVQSVNVTTEELDSGLQSVLIEFGRKEFNGDGVTKSFTLDETFKEGSLTIYKNGILAQKDVEYTEGSERLTFDYITSPDAEDIIEARYVKE